MTPSSTQLPTRVGGNSLGMDDVRAEPHSSALENCHCLRIQACDVGVWLHALVFACHKDVGSMTKVVEDVMTISNAPPSSEWTRRWPIGNGKENKSFLCRQILFRLNQNQSKPWMILFSRGRETLELITKGGHASLRPFRALPLFAKNFTKEYFEIFKDQTDMALFPKNNVSMLP